MIYIRNTYIYIYIYIYMTILYDIYIYIYVCEYIHEFYVIWYIYVIRIYIYTYIYIYDYFIWYIYIYMCVWIYTWVLYNMIYLVHLGHPHVLNGRTPATLPHCHIPEATLWSQLLCWWNWNQRLPPTAPWFPSWIPWSATPPIPAGRCDKGWNGAWID